MLDGSLGYHPTSEISEAEIGRTAPTANGHPITVDILGPSRCRFGDIEVRARDPMLAMARRLIQEGMDPDTLVRFVSKATGVQSLKTTSLRVLAAWDIEESSTRSLRLIPYRPFSREGGGARAAFSGQGGTPLPD